MHGERGAGHSLIEVTAGYPSDLQRAGAFPGPFFIPRQPAVACLPIRGEFIGEAALYSVCASVPLDP